jgi:hypothetical protein
MPRTLRNPAQPRQFSEDTQVAFRYLTVNVTAKEAARLLGDWSTRSVYRYGSYLGARRFGRSVRFDRETVLRIAREGLPPDARPAQPARIRL